MLLISYWLFFISLQWPTLACFSALYLQMTYFVFIQKWLTFFFLMTWTEHASKALWLKRHPSPLEIHCQQSVMVQASLPCQHRTSPKEIHDKGLHSGHAEWKYLQKKVYTHMHPHAHKHTHTYAWSPVLPRLTWLQFLKTSTLTLIWTDMVDT